MTNLYEDMGYGEIMYLCMVRVQHSACAKHNTSTSCTSASCTSVDASRYQCSWNQESYRFRCWKEISPFVSVVLAFHFSLVKQQIFLIYVISIYICNYVRMYIVYMHTVPNHSFYSETRSLCSRFPNRIVFFHSWFYAEWYRTQKSNLVLANPHWNKCKTHHHGSVWIMQFTWIKSRFNQVSKTRQHWDVES